MKRLRLPHEESLRPLLQRIKDNVTQARTCVIDGVEVRYMVCSSWPDGVDEAVYDEEGNIYLPETLVRADRRRADLTAYHEKIEINHKLAGRSHAYAHRRALLLELLAAKRMVSQPAQLRRYVRERVNGYPQWKIPDRQDVEDRLYHLVVQETPPRGKILEVITESRM